MVQRLRFSSWFGRPKQDEIVGDGEAIKRVISSRNIAQVRAAIIRRYGFEPPDLYIADLIDFVEQLTRDGVGAQGAPPDSRHGGGQSGDKHDA